MSPWKVCESLHWYCNPKAKANKLELMLHVGVRNTAYSIPKFSTVARNRGRRPAFGLQVVPDRFRSRDGRIEGALAQVTLRQLMLSELKIPEAADSGPCRMGSLPTSPPLPSTNTSRAGGRTLCFSQGLSLETLPSQGEIGRHCADSATPYSYVRCWRLDSSQAMATCAKQTYRLWKLCGPRALQPQAPEPEALTSPKPQKLCFLRGGQCCGRRSCTE